MQSLFPPLPAARVLLAGGRSFGEMAVPVLARQDPGGLADVSCLSGVRGPDKCRGRARGWAVSSTVGSAAAGPSRARRSGCAPALGAVRLASQQNLLRAQIRCGLPEPDGPSEHPSRDTRSALATPAVRLRLPRPAGLCRSGRQGSSVPGFLQLFVLFPPLPPPLQLYQLC